MTLWQRVRGREATRRLACDATTDVRRPHATRDDRVAIYLRYVKLSIQINTVEPGEEGSGGGSVVSSQQALLSGHTVPKPPIQPFGLNLYNKKRTTLFWYFGPSIPPK